MRPSDFPRDEMFRNPRTPPFRDGQGVCHVFSYDHVLRVLTNADNAFSRDPSRWLPPGPHAPSLDFMWLTEPFTVGGGIGRHTALRSVAEPWFRSRAVRTMEPVVRDAAGQLVSAVAAEGQGEFNLAQLAQQLSLRVICRLIGVELDREAWLREKLTEHVHSSFADMPIQWDLQAYFWNVIARRLAHPQDELLDVLIGAWRGGEIDDKELLGFLNGLVIAGTDTTAASLVNALALPAEFGLLDYVKSILDDEAALRDFIEEVVRFAAPFPAKPISVLSDSRFGDLDVPAGSTLYLWYAAANRDEAVNGGVPQADPQEFDPQRSPNKHVGFGRGRHRCLGADLARLETGVLLQALLRRIPDLRMSQTRPFVRHAGVVDEASEAWFTYRAGQAGAPLDRPGSATGSRAGT